MVTVTTAAADVVLAPTLSVATAVTEYVPAATLAHVAAKGAEVIAPIRAVPAKNSTRATAPPLSLAEATNGMVAGAANVAPPTGEVSATVGGVFAVVEIVADVVAVDVAPALSVIVSVIVYVPPVA